MLKRSLFFKSRSTIRFRQNQMLIKLPDENEEHSVPIEDIGLVVLEHPAITLSHQVLGALLEAKVVIITCNSKFMPSGLLLPIVGHSSQTQRYSKQIDASKPLRKKLWQQTVKAKISNQSKVLKMYDLPWLKLHRLVKSVRSGDPENLEAQAASFYWKQLFNDLNNFVREYEDGTPPNNMLNYGYAILRSCVARAIVSSGLIPSLGIHHKNKYNPFCLADDLMEPYRPLVDLHIKDYWIRYGTFPDELSQFEKSFLLKVLQQDVVLDYKKRPMWVAIIQTASSLASCFEGDAKQIKFPTITDEYQIKSI